MSADRDVTLIVRSWLEEGVTALPDNVLDSVLDQVPTTRQRRAWWPARRLPHMNTPIKIAIATVAVVVFALTGVDLTSRNASVGGPPSSPMPSPSAVPTLPPTGTLVPGTYRSDFITYTLPAGWVSYQGWAVEKDGGNPPGGMAVTPWRQIATVYGDPCRWQTTAVPVGPTVDAVVAALAAQTRGATVTPVDVTIDGFSGREIDLMVPLDIILADCDGGQYKAWTDIGGDRYNQGPGQHDLLDVLDVEGTTLAIDRTFFSATTAADRAQEQAILDSITITPPAPAPTLGPSPAPTP